MAPSKTFLAVALLLAVCAGVGFALLPDSSEPTGESLVITSSQSLPPNLSQIPDPNLGARNPIEVITCGPGGGIPLSLTGMFGYRSVVVGTVGPIIRMVYAENDFQHTVYEFYVDFRLKDDDRRRDRVIKVRQSMGNLPWSRGENSGIGMRIMGEPMLVPGKRYLLFLGGVPGDYTIPNKEYGQIVIERDRLLFPQIPGKPVREPWRFKRGPQLLGLSERAAIELILKEFTLRDAEVKAEEKKARIETVRQLKIAKRKRPLPPEDPPDLSGGRRPPPGP